MVKLVHALRPLSLYCDSYDVMFMFYCELCKDGNYVSETDSRFRLRFNNHMSWVRRYTGPGGEAPQEFWGVWSHHLATITPKSVLDRRGSTCQGPIYGLNGLFFVSCLVQQSRTKVLLPCKSRLFRRSYIVVCGVATLRI